MRRIRSAASQGGRYRSMMSAARGWLGRVPTTDPFERRTAIVVQAFCMGLSALLVVNEVIHLWRGTLASGVHALFADLAELVTVAVSLAAVVLIRRGSIRAGYAVALSGYVAVLSLSLGLRGLEYHRFFLVRVFAILLVLPGLLLGRRALWTTLGVLFAAMLVGHLRDLGRLGGHGPLR